MNEFNYWLLFFIFILGLCFGSFLNVIVYRLPLKQSIITPPSSCPSCGIQLGGLELIPLLSYIFLRGRCRHCNTKISARYPLVELATGILFAIVYYRYQLTVDTAFYLILLYLLLAIALIDLENRVVPNVLVTAGLILGALFYILHFLNYILNIPAALLVKRLPADAFLGLLVGSAIMLLIFLASRGGMGAGDIKLMAFIGLFVGLQGTAVVMLFAFFLGALYGVAMMLIGKLTRKDALPFAPFLALATFVQVLWGTQIWNWYINLLR